MLILSIRAKDKLTFERLQNYFFDMDIIKQAITLKGLTINSSIPFSIEKMTFVIDNHLQ